MRKTPARYDLLIGAEKAPEQRRRIPTAYFWPSTSKSSSHFSAVGLFGGQLAAGPEFSESDSQGLNIEYWRLNRDENPLRSAVGIV